MRIAITSTIQVFLRMKKKDFVHLHISTCIHSLNQLKKGFIFIMDSIYYQQNTILKRQKLTNKIFITT